MTKVSYEWVCELVDQDGDIVDTHFGDTRAEVEGYRDPDYKCDIALVKHEYIDHEGDVGRGYAYLDADGNLPDTFDGDVDPTIPKRFR